MPPAIRSYQPCLSQPTGQAGVQSVSITGLAVTIDSFVNLSGNFAFQKDASGNIEAAANNVVATLGAGPVTVGVTGGTLALLLKADGKALAVGDRLVQKDLAQSLELIAKHVKIAGIVWRMSRTRRAIKRDPTRRKVQT